MTALINSIKLILVVIKNAINIRVPTYTIAELQAYSGVAFKVVEINDILRAGTFYHDPADTTTVHDGAMTIVTADGKRYKRPFNGTVEPRWFGATLTTTFSNETVVMQAAINFLISKQGGVLRLGNKIYTCNLVWNGPDNISVEGTGRQSALNSAITNTFAIRVETGHVGIGSYFSSFRVYGDDNRLRHGIYLNCAAYYKFHRVRIDSCGIGVLSNGTIDNSFIECDFRQCYVGVIIGTFNAGHTSISDITGQTVTFTPAFTDTQPSEQTFVACQWMANHFHVVIDYPNNPVFATNANIKITGGAMQFSEVGIYIAQKIDNDQYPLVLDNVWLENFVPPNGGLPQMYDGFSVPVNDLYMQGGQAVIKNTGIDRYHLTNGSTLHATNVVMFGGLKVVEDSSSFVGKEIVGDDIYFPYYLESGINSRLKRNFAFHTTHKTNYVDRITGRKVYSNSTTSKSILFNKYLGTETITVVNDGLFDGTCWEIFLPIGGIFTFNATVVHNKVSVCTLALKKVTGNSIFLGATSGSIGAFNMHLALPTEWTTLAVVGRVVNSGTGDFGLWNTTGSPLTFRISGIQMLEFDNQALSSAFLRTSDFLPDAALTFPKQTNYRIASSVTSNSTTRSNLTAWTFPVVAGRIYEIDILAMYQTSVTTTGGSMGVILTNDGVGTIIGLMNAAIDKNSVATELKVPINLITNSNNQVDSFLTTTGVSVIDSPHFWEARLEFTCTTSGNFQITWGSEVNSSNAMLLAGSKLTVIES